MVIALCLVLSGSLESVSLRRGGRQSAATRAAAITSSLDSCVAQHTSMLSI